MKKKNIALVAHDNRKKEMLEWVEWNRNNLKKHNIICTGTTGKYLEKVFSKEDDKKDKINITKLNSGALGGDQQMGAMIVDGKIDLMVFLWDPMQPQPHDVDVKALLRITVLYNLPTACNRSTADFLISSPFFNEDYNPDLMDVNEYKNRKIDD